jgi:hypothetical protein
VIGVVTLLWNAMGAYDYLMTQTRNADYLARFTPEQVAYFTGFPAWVDGTWALAVWGGVLGSVLLLWRRRLAVPVLAVSLGAMVITTVHNYVLSDGLQIMEGPGPLLFSVAIFLVAVGLLLDARAMARRRVLR